MINLGDLSMMRKGVSLVLASASLYVRHLQPNTHGTTPISRIAFPSRSEG